jgi:hypothetical protein
MAENRQSISNRLDPDITHATNMLAQLHQFAGVMITQWQTTNNQNEDIMRTIDDQQQQQQQILTTNNTILAQLRVSIAANNASFNNNFQMITGHLTDVDGILRRLTQNAGGKKRRKRRTRRKRR